MAKKFLTGITIATAVGGEYTFPIADGSANQAIVTDGNGNLSFGSAIASTAEDAQRLVCEMINASGSSISAFRPVCCVGIHSDGTPEIALARADNPLFMPAIGITQSSVGNNNRTDVLLYGKLEGVNTTPYATGDTLYVAPTGGWATTRPTGNNLIQAVFKVGRIQQNNGSGGAFGAGQYQDLPNVPEGNVWIGNSNSYPIATPLSTAIPAALGYTPVPNSRTITINGTTYDLSADRSWTVSANQNARTEYEFTTNGSTATYSATYTVGQVDVFYNGSKLSSAEFTATNGTSVTLAFTPPSGQVVEVVAWETGGGVANSRTLTINGTAYDLSANRSWTIDNTSLGAQPQLNGTGFVKVSGTTVSYDNSTYLTTSSALSTYMPLSGGIFTGTTRMDGSGGTTPSITMVFNSGINRLLAPLLRLYGATNETSNYVELFGSLATQNRTIQLPDASGTIALTSNLSAYLPLTGGTLTGALSGTSATFSTSISTSNLLTIVYADISTGDNRGLRIINTDATEGTAYNITSGRTGQNNGDFVIRNTTTGVNNLVFNRTTGAATFSSSVTATSFEVGNGQFYKARRSSGNLLIDLLGIESGTDNTRLLITGDFNIKNGSLSTLFNMTTTGAATFASTLTMSAYSYASSAIQFTRANTNTVSPGSGNGILVFSGGNAQMRMDTSNGINFDMFNSGGTTHTALKIQQNGNTVVVNSPDNSLPLAFAFGGTIHGYMGAASSALYAYSNNGGYVLLNASSVWVAASDAKRKRNFETYSLGLDAILGLKPKRYNMDFQEDGDEKQIGLIAQEVKEHIPQAFEQNEDFIGINYNVIIVTLVNAIQELKAEIDALENK
jgi:predicted heme/steroid binding protein